MKIKIMNVTMMVIAACACLSVFSVTPGESVLRSNLNSVLVYPNPFQPGQGHTGVTFGELTNEVRIRIYTLNGKLVREITSDASGGAIVWDATNGSGDPVASGLYLYLITDANGQKVQGRLAVLR